MTSRRLTLAKETLTELTTSELSSVRGALPDVTGQPCADIEAHPTIGLDCVLSCGRTCTGTSTTSG